MVCKVQIQVYEAYFCLKFVTINFREHWNKKDFFLRKDVGFLCVINSIVNLILEDR